MCKMWICSLSHLWRRHACLSAVIPQQLWCLNSHDENISSHGERLHSHTSAVLCLVWEEKELVINNSISFTPGFSLFRFPSHLDSLSLFCLISFSLYLTALLSSSTSLLFATFFLSHRSFPHRVPLFLINLPHLICLHPSASPPAVWKSTCVLTVLKGAIKLFSRKMQIF